jgi:putative flippase GtrA
LFRFFIFSVGSSIGALIDFGLALLLLQKGLDGWMALAIAMSVSASVVYVIHQKVTFGDLHSHKLHAGRLAAFLASTAMIYFFRLTLFEILRRFGTVLALALGVALVASIAVNFIVSRTLIFSASGRR